MDLTELTFILIDKLAGDHLSRADVIEAAIEIVHANPTLLEDWLWDQPIALRDLDDNGFPNDDAPALPFSADSVMPEEVAHG